MGRIAIVTDSNSGITQMKGKELNITVLPMPFTIDEKTYYEDINLSQEQFYEKLVQDYDISTSQPIAGNVIDTWNALLKEYDEIVHIPMSSGLSSSCATAVILSEEFHGKVQVVNNQRISVTQQQSVLDAIYLRDAGKNALEIKEILEAAKRDSSIYIMVDTLKFLKKGGRITPAASAVGTILNLKPVLQIQGDKLDAFVKARNIKHAKRVMIDAIKQDMKTRFADFTAAGTMRLAIAYTENRESANEFQAEVSEQFPAYEIEVYPLPLSIACHIGPSAIAVACINIITV